MGPLSINKCLFLPDGIIKDKPEAEALLTTDLDLCLVAFTTTGCTALPIGDNSLLFSDDDVPVSILLCSSSTDIENLGRMSRL